MIVRHVFVVILVCVVARGVAASSLPGAAVDLSKYEGRTVTSVEVVLEDVPRDQGAEAELLSLLTVAPNTKFAAVRVRESLQALFGSGRVASARVEAFEAGGAAPGGALSLRFIVRPQVRVGDVNIEIGAQPSDAPISADEIRARLNLLESGGRVSEQALKNNADLIQAYLRDRGFYRADVTYQRTLDASGMRANITFRITPGEQSRVEAFNVNITGFDKTRVLPALKLAPGVPFTRTALGEDIGRIRQAIIAQGNLAPQFDTERVILDPTRNTVTISLKGGIGPKVNVVINGDDISDKKARELLPVKREGSIDQSAIVEGARRLRNSLQENGYFFAQVDASCAVASGPNAAPTPTATPTPIPATTNAEIGISTMAETCENLDPQALSGSTVKITYNVERGRRFKLTSIRIEGTNKLSYEQVADQLRSQTSSVLAIVPLLGGYGRGYTSAELLEQDRRTVEARMRDLGYRKANVTVRQGVSLNSENLIITFNVTEGPLTRVAGVEVRGNEIYTAERLRKEPCAAAHETSQPCTIIDGPYSRTQARTDAERIRSLYARNGYVDADVRVDVVELPKKGDDEQVRLVYNTTEGGKVFVNRIVINGNEGISPDARLRTKREAILKAIPLKEGEALRADSLTESERILYNTNAFRQVVIRTEPAGETASGFRRRDVIIDLEELPPRRLDYGGGYSTDNGPLGLFEIQNNNLFGQLREGALRLRASRRQQLLRLEYFDPRFRAYGLNGFSPLTISAQYQRDISVTRFFRSTIDRGNFGIVQRLDAKGNPIDEFGIRTGEPTINRFTFNVETQRALDRSARTIFFARYSYEDVRLFNIGSLLVAPLLRPDRAVRLSRFGATLTRDTRDSQFDPKRGEFFTVDYGLALRQLGGNLSFNKVQTTYRRYYQINGRGRGTVLAGSVSFGAANLFNPRDRDGIPGISDVDRTLPISERFFSGGSISLRGFGFDEAGPRVAICPNGETLNSSNGLPPLTCGSATLRDNNGRPVTINPFLVPIGGNALAIVNAEARVPLNKTFQIVPFYDGGNVFRRVGDIFGRNLRPGDDPNFRAQWTHTVGLGFRVKTPFGPLAVDYGYLLNPPEFTLPQQGLPPATIRLRRAQIHFRFGQTF